MMTLPHCLSPPPVPVQIVVGPAPTAQDFFDHGTKLKLTVAIDMHSSQVGACDEALR